MKSTATARKGENIESHSRKIVFERVLLGFAAVLLAVALFYMLGLPEWFSPGRAIPAIPEKPDDSYRVQPNETWMQRAYLIDRQYRNVYNAGWEGANGAIGNAYMYAVTKDSGLLIFHTRTHPLVDLFNGTWVDDRAWNGLAEMYWWSVTGKSNRLLVESARNRYESARKEGRLSNHEGFWSWYNWPPGANVQDDIMTNSNMNHMVSLACWLYDATGEKKYLEDALLVWDGDANSPGVEKTFYRGNGKWEGKDGLAAFGKQLPWNGTAYCSIAAALYRATKQTRFRDIAVATAKRIMNPKNGWVDATDFYQRQMDGNGAFVHYLLDAYEIAPKDLANLLPTIGKMLEHVWTNHHGKATVTLHLTSNHGIRNGWNPKGGEDGYGVDQVGTTHAQSQAVRAFGVYAYFINKSGKKGGNAK